MALAVFVASSANAAWVNLIAFVSGSIENGGVSLPDNSIVLIFGSGDNVNDGPTEYGDGFIADSTQNDDVYLGWARIDNPSYDDGGGPVDGTFVSDQVISFNTDDIGFIYIRFFDTTDYPVQGEDIDWGYSDATAYNLQFNTAIWDGGPDLETTETDNFYVIPEPRTLSLLLLMLPLAAGMRVGMARARRSRQRRQAG